MSCPSFYYALGGQSELVSVKKLRRLSRYLGLSSDYFNDEITGIKKSRVFSIKYPKFPFDLNNEKGQYLS